MPQTMFFTEMGLLGVDHTGVYPSNVTSGQNSQLYLVVTNHLAFCAYYSVEIKLLSESQEQPNGFNHTNSDVAPLSSLTFFVANNQTYELPIDISFQYKADATARRLDVHSLTVNGIDVDTTGISFTWNSEKSGYSSNLVFELYVYNDTVGSFQYHERFVNLWLKMNV